MPSVLAILAGCSDSSDFNPSGPAFEPADFTVRESIEQLHVSGAQPGQLLAVYDGQDTRLASGAADELGSLIFRQLPAGHSYTVREEAGDPVEAVENLAVMSVEDSEPDNSFYTEQVLQPGFTYITTRDGTRLSTYITLPGPIEDGPYPTIVNYSGYEPSRPGRIIDQNLVGLCGTLPILCDAPYHPSGLIAGFVGYATVGVNMRGTGCSGGAYDYFQTLQVLDGYDIIETIAAQSWVYGNKVGMTGLSFPGISQLFVAQSRPPSLAAIAPLSVIADSYSSTLAPGGMLNNLFALDWGDGVAAGAEPFGQGWERAQVELEYEESGSSICEDNQQMRLQTAATNRVSAGESPYYDPETADPLNPSTFVGKIDVPVFLSGAWQDEQTSSHFATMLDKFASSPLTRFIAFNGLHADGYSPEILAEWKAFMDIYVAEQVPNAPPALAFSGPLFEQNFGAPLSFPSIPYSDEQSYEAARTAYEEDMAQSPVRIIFDRGADPDLFAESPGDPDYRGAPQGAFSIEFSQWPPVEQEVMRLYLQPDGTLAATEPSIESSASSFRHDPEAGQRTFGGGQPFYEWAPTDPGKAAVFVSDVLPQDMVFVGSGSVDLFIQSSSEDADLEVMLSEVRQDGFETFVQAGWLRTSQRTLDADQATPLRPAKTYLEADATPLIPGEYAEARVEIFPFAHVFRAGSRIRLQVDTPGDSRELWGFILLEYDEPVTHTIAHSSEHPSSVALPLIPLAEVGSSPPPCPALRGQPCRPFEPYTNTPAEAGP